MSVGSAPTWYMMAVVTETVTLSFVLVLVCTSICLVIIETLVTVAMGHNTRLQPGWAIPENLPQFWMTPLSALSMHTAQKHWVAMFKRMSSRCPTGLCSAGTRGDMSEWPQVAAVSTRPHTTVKPARQRPHKLCTQRALAAPSAGNLGGGREHTGCPRAQRERQHQRARNRYPQPPTRYRRHCYPHAELARGRVPRLGTRPGARHTAGRAVVLRCALFSQSKDGHTTSRWLGVPKPEMLTALHHNAHIQCRVLHLALPRMKRCCLGWRLRSPGPAEDASFARILSDS